MKKTIITYLTIIGCAGALHARTWTSTDGEKTFEADYISHTDSDITVMKDSKKLTFKLNLLSDADQAWVKEQVPAEPEITATDKATTATEEPSELVKDINKNLTKFDGRRYKKHTPDNSPEYYLLYFSASW